MTWTKLSDDYADRLEDLELSASACWLHTAALIYCNRVGNDGRLPMSKLGKVTSIDAPEVYAAELEEHGLWARLHAVAAWQVDWKDQEPAQDVEKRKEAARVRQQRQRQHNAGDHSKCQERYCKNAAVTRDTPVETPSGPSTGVTRDSRRESRPPSRPSRPKERGRAGDSAATASRCSEHPRYRGGVDADGDPNCEECAASRITIAPVDGATATDREVVGL